MPKGHIARLAFLLTFLLGIALENTFALKAQDQLSLARWDKSVLKISQNIDRGFIADEFIDSLWFDCGLDHNWLIGPANTVLAKSFEDEVQFNTGELLPTEPLYQIIEMARNSFFKYRTITENNHSNARTVNVES